MSSTDDLLYEPFQSVVSAQNIDFLVRKNANGWGYDWKPVSDRAISWAKIEYPRAESSRHMRMREGWMLAFGVDPDARAPSVISLEELRRDSYIFVMGNDGKY